MTMSVLPQTYVRLTPPVTLHLRVSPNPRPRVTPGPEVPENRVDREFSALPLTLTVDAQARTMRAHLSPIPSPLTLYGPEDFSAACADTMEQHAERVLELLGADPTRTLQALIDGIPLPETPPRVPREIANWRAKAVLASMNLLDEVDAYLSALPEPQRTVAAIAWAGDAKLARRGPTVLAMADALQLADAQIDNMFRAAEEITI